MARRYREPAPPTFGWFRYKNISGGDLLLQRPLKNGVHLVTKDFYFEGDSFYRDHHGVKMVANLSGEVSKGQEKFKKTLEEAKSKVAKPTTRVPVRQLSHKELLREARLKKERKMEEENKLLTEQPVGTLDFYTDSENTSTPAPANSSDLLSEDEGNEPGLTKKELLEFASLKGIQVNPNWSKEKILKTVRA